MHSHTWYANFAGHLSSLLYGVPHVVTAHSLEPLRPWKAEQLGGGYAVSSWVEKTSYLGAAAVIAVSAAMRDDVLASYPDIDPAKVKVVHNGIDTDDWAPVERPRHGAPPRRRPGPALGGLRRPDHPAEGAAAVPARGRRSCRPEVQIVLCAGAPDTPEIEAEVVGLVDGLARDRDGVVWIREMLPRPDVVALLSAATAFACPSIYEPLGIVNLEAMACETAVVATATGGIPEVVVDSGDDGRPAVSSRSSRRPTAPARRSTPSSTSRTSPRRSPRSSRDPERAAEMGRAGRRRAIEAFSWDAIAEQTAGGLPLGALSRRGRKPRWGRPRHARSTSRLTMSESKLVFAPVGRTAGTGLGRALRDPGLHARLAAAGVRRLQLGPARHRTARRCAAVLRPTGAGRGRGVDERPAGRRHPAAAAAWPTRWPGGGSRRTGCWSRPGRDPAATVVAIVAGPTARR